MPPNQRLKLTGARRLRNESFFSAPQLKRDPLGSANVSCCVAIVAHPDFEPLTPLAERVHVWLAETSPNRGRAEAYWRAHPQKSLEQGVTTFKVRLTDSPEQMVLGTLGVVDLHHGEYSHTPPWDTLEIYGASPTPALSKALLELGASEMHPIPGGFRASKSLGSAA